MRDAWRLALGTLTALPVPPPSRVDRHTAARAVLLAPLAVLPLGLAVVAVALLARWGGLPPLVAALLAVGTLALGTRALHWDGLSDTADGLSASYDRERSLAVMKSGTSGPSGVVATVLVAGLQVAALASLLVSFRGALVAGLAVCCSRAALALTCLRGVRPARRDGLGQPLSEVVSPVAAVLLWLLTTAALTGMLVWAGLDWWRGPVAAVVAVLAVGLLVRRALARFGGVTGDVFGAAVEVALAALLVALS